MLSAASLDVIGRAGASFALIRTQLRFNILGFNYDFNALDPMGKRNELHDAFEKFQAKDEFNVVALLGIMFPVLGSILKIFASFPFSSP